MGWQSLMNGLFVSLPLERLPKPRHVEARRLEAEAAAERLEPLHRLWAAHYNGPLARGPKAARPFGEVVQRPWETRPRPVYELDGAYCVIELARKDGETELTVVDYAFAGPEGRKNLLAFLSLFSGQAGVVHLHLPSDDPLAADGQPFMRPNHHNVQARVVDVKHALAALSPTTGARFSLRVHDDFCAWNNTTTLLEFSRGHLDLKPWAQSPDVDIDVRGQAALLMGGLTAGAALRSGLASGEPEPLRALAALSGGRPVFMPRADYF
jgi:hypothetical protein